jgi:AcrR family transcriptional regulator
VTDKNDASNTTRDPLNKERVFQTAVRLADEAGVASLSMRKLADRLGVQAMSLYHHVANKNEVISGMVDHVFSEIALPARETPWKLAMQQRAVSARVVLTRHPWAIGLMDSRANPGPATLAHHDAVIGCLREGGFSIGMAAHAFSVLDSYIYGFTLQELSLPFSAPDELEAVADSILEGAAETYPYMTEMIVAHALKTGYSYADEFMFGLELILEGLERLHSEDA